MLVEEKTLVHIHQYPYVHQLNEDLHRIIVQRAYKEDFGAVMTSYKTYDVPQFNKIGTFAADVIRTLEWGVYTPVADLEDKDEEGLILKDLWGQYYRKGDYQRDHSHVPNSWSFVYYVNTPKGSSPLVFTQSKKKIYPKEGQIVIFPSWVRHHVPKNRCEGRSVVAGNFYYQQHTDWKVSSKYMTREE